MEAQAYEVEPMPFDYEDVVAAPYVPTPTLPAPTGPLSPTIPRLPPEVVVPAGPVSRRPQRGDFGYEEGSGQEYRLALREWEAGQRAPISNTADAWREALEPTMQTRVPTPLGSVNTTPENIEELMALERAYLGDYY